MLAISSIVLGPRPNTCFACKSEGRSSSTHGTWASADRTMTWRTSWHVTQGMVRGHAHDLDSDADPDWWLVTCDCWQMTHGSGIRLITFTCLHMNTYNTYDHDWWRLRFFVDLFLILPDAARQWLGLLYVVIVHSRSTIDSASLQNFCRICTDLINGPP